MRYKVNAERSVHAYKRCHDRAVKAPANFRKADQSVRAVPAELLTHVRRAYRGCEPLEKPAKFLDPFRVTNVRSDMMTIDQNGVRHPVSINRVKPVQANQ